METGVLSSAFATKAGLDLGSQDRITVLIVGSDSNGAGQLHNICHEFNWDVRIAGTRADARQALAEKSIPVVVCTRELSDGSKWEEILQDTAQQMRPPTLIVTDRLADERLWAQVLNLGGYDVLAQPFDLEEISRVVNLAWLHWLELPSS